MLVPLFAEQTADEIERLVLGCKPAGFFGAVRGLVREFAQALEAEQRRANKLNRMPSSPARDELMAVHQSAQREIIAMGRALNLLPDQADSGPPKLQ